MYTQALAYYVHTPPLSYSLSHSPSPSRAPTQQPPAYMQGYGQQQQHYMAGGGGYGNHPMQLSNRGDSVVQVKEEKVDPEYYEVERKL